MTARPAAEASPLPDPRAASARAVPEQRERVASGTLVDATACTRYADAARQKLATRLETERATP